MAWDAVPSYTIPEFCHSCGQAYPWTEPGEIKGVYEPGGQYNFYRDLSSIISTAKTELFIIDAYLNEQVFNLYVEKVPDRVKVRILSKKIDDNVVAVAKMYAGGRPLELRSSADVHDRAVFIDRSGWVIGQSIKDAARTKLAHMIELEGQTLTASRKIHDQIWDAAAVVI
jgi:hypothetical protein